MQREKLLFFIEISQVSMHKPREAVVHESYIKRHLLSPFFLFITFGHLLCFLHQIHKWRDNLIEALLILDVIIFAILCEYKFNHVFVKLLLSPCPFCIGPHHSLIFHVTHSQLDLLVVLDIVGVAASRVFTPED